MRGLGGRGRVGFLLASTLVVAGLAARPAGAAPVTYFLESGQITTIQLVDIAPPLTPTPCPVGLGNCLVNAPLAIDGASVTLDLATNTLIDINIFVSGPGTLDMNGLNGYEQVVFNDVTFQTSGSSALFPVVVNTQYNFAAAGTVTSPSVQLFFLGNPGPTPDLDVPFNNPTTPTGNIVFEPGQLVLTLTGVDLGVFLDPQGGNPVLAKADFTFTAAVPEPRAAVLYGVALLIVSVTLRRRQAVS